MFADPRFGHTRKTSNKTLRQLSGDYFTALGPTALARMRDSMLRLGHSGIGIIPKMNVHFWNARARLFITYFCGWLCLNSIIVVFSFLELCVETILVDRPPDSKPFV